MELDQQNVQDICGCPWHEGELHGLKWLIFWLCHILEVPNMAAILMIPNTSWIQTLASKAESPGVDENALLQYDLVVEICLRDHIESKPSMRRNAATNRSRRNDAMMGIEKGKWSVSPTCWRKQNTRTPNGQLLRHLNATTISLICFHRHTHGSDSFSILNGYDSNILRCNDLSHRVQAYILASQER
ncbi:unnamed protein product [Arabidopsis thaliana]|uniref:Uncharacterized protein n=1 Tax=Arabidopsis thaliana TaxID=3702 RepID=Q9LU32_ARATH|nr:unnamed protein product [Arabidopsis thaliana]